MMKSQLNTISQYSSLQQNLKTIQEKQYTRIRHISSKHKKKTEKVDKIIEQEIQDKIKKATKNRQRAENHWEKQKELQTQQEKLAMKIFKKTTKEADERQTLYSLYGSATNPNTIKLARSHYNLKSRNNSRPNKLATLP